MPTSQLIQYAGAAIFAIAVLHTFSTKFFDHLSHTHPRHAGLFHLLGEVEAVFGFWAMVLILFMAATADLGSAIGYLESQNLVEPLFVFVILVMAGTRPILHLARRLVDWISAALPLAAPVSYYITCLTVVPLLGSIITEPAAMTLAALLLRDRFYVQGISKRLKYVTLGILLVNVSIGGVLTPYAAPPVLMVAAKWNWDLFFMLSNFGWKAALAVAINAAAAGMLFRRELSVLNTPAADAGKTGMPLLVVAIHLLFLLGVVYFNHHPVVFFGLFLFFLGFTEAYSKHQDPLMLREGLMVAFFLAGLVILGGLQKWWLQPLLAGMDATVLYFGATALTAITDNAALTYLGSLVEGISDQAKYALVAGAVTGGGLTVIANAPNPAGFAILKGSFDEESISPLGLLGAALPPTIVAMLCFLLL
ncbi:MAG TPA: hypothetical protein DHV59_12390 [Oxalobacteraceae bacterium]|nr:hypothetical protein [Oxalobacteraceae bacterium]